jgi:hypothetical protein
MFNVVCSVSILALSLLLFLFLNFILDKRRDIKYEKIKRQIQLNNIPHYVKHKQLYDLDITYFSGNSMNKFEKEIKRS